MHLEKIEVQGFKSFAEKITFLFPGFEGDRYGITAVIGPNGSGKCIHGDSRVVLSDGRVVSIRELVETSLATGQVEEWDDGYCSYNNSENLRVLSLNQKTLKIEPRPIQAFIKRTAPAELFKITTKTGRSLIATGYHPLFTLESGFLKTVRADELRTGLRVALPRYLPLEHTSDRLNFVEALRHFEREDSVYVPYSAPLERWINHCNKKNGGLYANARSMGINPIHLDSIREEQAINLGTIRRLQEQWSGPVDEWFGYQLKSRGTGYISVPRQLTPALARILGYCISEGRITFADQVWFVNSDPALIEDFCLSMRDVFGLEARVLTYKPSTKDVIAFSHTLCQYFEKAFQLGIEQPSAKKQVPDAIFSASDDVVRAFLSALYEGDGHVSCRQEKKSLAYIEYSTASSRLAEDVSILLARFGIQSRISSKWKAATNTEKKIKRHYYSVYIYGIENLKRAAEVFRFRGVKRFSLKRIAILHHAPNPNDDIVPGATKIVRNLIKAMEVPIKPIRKECPTLAAYNERRCDATRFGIKRALEAAKKYGRKKDGGEVLRGQLERLAESDTFWDSIVSIEKVSGEEWVYDLAVEGHHNFIANGMIVHNSNVADAIRWVLGEQSLKLLRSKRAEDVIFFGSSQKAQKGFCEVSLTFNNDDRIFPVDYAEVVITRRLYRDGASEYLLNKNKVRLADIALMLAQAHIGQKSYSVIGQGMVDAILQTAPADRKEFFNEAVGVRQYQIKRDAAVSKLKSTNENLIHAQTVLTELEPKMRFFARQLKRLEEREEVEREYIALQKQYTNVLWNDLKERKDIFGKERDVHQEKSDLLEQRQRALEQEFAENEKSVRSPVRSSFQTLSQQLSDLQKEKQKIVTRISVVDSRLQTELVASGKGQLAWLTGRKDELMAKRRSIDEEIAGLEQDHQRLRKQEEQLLMRIREEEERARESHDIGALEQALQEIEELGSDAVAGDAISSLKEAIQKIVVRIRKVRETARALVAWLQGGRQEGGGDLARAREDLQKVRTQSEVVAARLTLRSEERVGLERDLAQTVHELSYLSQTDLSDQHAAAAQEKEALTAERESLEQKITEVQKELDGLYETEQETHRNLLELQKQMSALSKEHDAVRDALNRASLEIAKLEAHQEELLAKICDELRVGDAIRAELSTGIETVYSALGFLEESLSLDRDETRAQIERLRRKLEQIGTIDQDVITEHEEAKGRFEFLQAQTTDLIEARETLQSAIAELDIIIQERFEKNLDGISKKFGEYFARLFDGGAARLVVLRRQAKKQEQEEEDEEDEEEGEENDDAIAGIEIEATPPGKKFKSLSFLSGGEKALTAIALLCAILAQNPSPFVVLDEVDAALDEFNANRFASIIKDLSPQTQFILITHNRVTMHIASVLYGVTMGEGGVSSMLSLDIGKLDAIVTS